MQEFEGDGHAEALVPRTRVYGALPHRTEYGRIGGISLSAFWSRRVRRLLPGLVLMLVVVALVTMKTATFSERAHMRGAASAPSQGWRSLVEKTR